MLPLDGPASSKELGSQTVPLRDNRALLHTIELLHDGEVRWNGCKVSRHTWPASERSTADTTTPTIVIVGVLSIPSHPHRYYAIGLGSNTNYTAYSSLYEVCMFPQLVGGLLKDNGVRSGSVCMSAVCIAPVGLGS